MEMNHSLPSNPHGYWAAAKRRVRRWLYAYISIKEK